MENKKYIQQIRQGYEKKHKEGYGSSYPESNVIRIYEIALRHYLKFDATNKNLLDFGCGNGTHSHYFKSKGFNVFGIDISEEAIATCHQTLNASSFHALDIAGDKIQLKNIFSQKMDVVFANHVLYYFNREDLSYLIDQFNEILNDDGLVIFSMMSTRCYWHNYSTQSTKDEYLRHVQFEKRICEDSYIHFIENEKELILLFSEFEHIFSGKYDFNFFEEGSTEHFFFIGRKRKIGVLSS